MTLRLSLLLCALFAGSARAQTNMPAWAKTAGDKALAADDLGFPSRAFALALPAAKRGDAVAMWKLGRLYREGRGTPQDDLEADAWLQKARAAAVSTTQQGHLGKADDGHGELPGALFVLGSLGETIEGKRDWDPGRDVPWLRKAAAYGYAPAETELGIILLDVEKRDSNNLAPEAVSLLRRAADADCIPAQVNLGFLFMAGRGVKQDYKEALRWYTRAAQAGSPYAQAYLAQMFSEGLGVPKDQAQADSWKKKAGEVKDAYDQCVMGQRYELGGNGVMPDENQAREWYGKAAAQGIRCAERLSRVQHPAGDILGGSRSAEVGAAGARTGEPAWVKTDGDKALAAEEQGFPSRAFALAKQGAERGDVVAMYMLDKLYFAPALYGGRVTPQDQPASQAWGAKALAAANIAAEHGDARACVVMAWLTHDKWVPNGPAEIVWWRKAAASGYAPAQDELGYLLVFGTGAVAANNSEALDSIRASAEQGYVLAQMRLGYLYSNGKGVAADQKIALHWYRAAAEAGNPEAQSEMSSIYRTGRGVRWNPQAAAEWDRKAHEIKDAYAQCLMWQRLETGGSGSPRDHEQALGWSRKAATQGLICDQVLPHDNDAAAASAAPAQPGGDQHAAAMASRGPSWDAFRYYQRTAALGDVDAKVNLSAIYAAIATILSAPILLLWLWKHVSAKGLDAFIDSIAASLPQGVLAAGRVFLTFIGVVSIVITFFGFVLIGASFSDSNGAPGALPGLAMLAASSLTFWVCVRSVRPRRTAPATAQSVATPAKPEQARAPSASEKLIGNRYEIDHLIGEGGMGMVYAGRDLKLGRFVAIKKMRTDLKLNRRDKDRFLKEARTSASLHHPCIVDIFDVVDQKRDLYLVFEYVDGQTLDRRLDEGPVAAEELASRLYFMCQALSFAHSKGVAHRDLKPSNIMFTRSGGAKVMDFGIAREMKDTTSRLTNMDTSGTLAYMAPEQELGRSDARSDIYSLGITLYQALTGKLPFPGPNFILQKERMLFEPLSQAAPNAPEKLRVAIERCLRRDPKERFQTIDEFDAETGAS